MHVDVEHVPVARRRVPSPLARNIDHVRRVRRRRIHAPARHVERSAAVEAVVNVAARIEHLRPVEKIRRHLPRALLDDRGDNAIRERHRVGRGGKCHIRPHTCRAAAGIVRPCDECEREPASEGSEEVGKRHREGRRGTIAERVVCAIDAGNSGERTPLACWFRRSAETDFHAVSFRESFANSAATRKGSREGGTPSPAGQRRALPGIPRSRVRASRAFAAARKSAGAAAPRLRRRAPGDRS